MNRQIIRQNRQVTGIRNLAALAGLAAALALAPLATVPAQRVVVTSNYSRSHVCTSSCASSCSWYRSPQYHNSRSHCSYYSQHGYHRSNCGCGQRDGYRSYYWSKRKQEDWERRVKELKREEERSRDRQDREARLENERRDRLERIEQLRADPEASRPKVFGHTANPTVDEALTAYFHYHQRQEAPSLTAARATAANAKPGPAPAAGLTAVGVDGWTYYYNEGRFYTLEGESLTETDAPIGALVFAIPAERKTVAPGEQPIYEVNGAFYQYTLIGDKPMYEVVPQPGSVAVAQSN